MIDVTININININIKINTIRTLAEQLNDKNDKKYIY